MSILVFIAGTLAALGGLVLLLAVTWMAFLGLNDAGKRRAAASRGGKHDRSRRKLRIPLLLLRALTWRKRRRNKHCAFLADLCGLTPDEQRAWARLEKEIR